MKSLLASLTALLIAAPAWPECDESALTTVNVVDSEPDEFTRNLWLDGAWSFGPITRDACPSAGWSWDYNWKTNGSALGNPCP